MPRIFIQSIQPEFIFFTNYKVMSSSIMKIMADYFPLAKRVTEDPLLFHLKKYKKLAICRNPVDRIFSLYKDKCHNDPVVKLNHKRDFFIQDSQVKILHYFYKILKINKQIVPPATVMESNHPLYPVLSENLNDLQNISLHDFILIIDEMFTENNLDQHFIPQTTFLTENGVLMIDHLYKMENIEETWPEICLILGKELPLLKRNSSEYSGTLPHYFMEPLNKTEAKIISERYNMDFHLLKYNPL